MRGDSVIKSMIEAKSRYLLALLLCSALVLAVEGGRVLGSTRVGSAIGCTEVTIAQTTGYREPAQTRRLVSAHDAVESETLTNSGGGPTAPITAVGEPVGGDIAIPVAPAADIYVEITVTSLLTMDNAYGNLYCATESMTNLTVDDGQVRQVVGPISVNSDMLVSNSTLVLQAQVEIGQNLDVKESTLFVMNTTQVTGKTTIDENSGSTLIAELSTAALTLHPNASLAFGSHNDTHLLKQPLVIVHSCNVELNGSIYAILSKTHMDLILTALNNSENVSIPFLQANCRVPIPLPRIPPVVIPKGFTNITAPLLLKVGSSQSSTGDNLLSMVFSLRGSAAGEPAFVTEPNNPNSTIQQSKSSNRNAIIIGASIGGAVALVAIIAILVLTIKPLNNLVFPHRRRALAQRSSL